MEITIVKCKAFALPACINPYFMYYFKFLDMFLNFMVKHTQK